MKFSKKFSLVFLATTLVSGFAHSNENTQRFQILNADQVELEERDCIVAMRSTLSQEELENRTKFECFSLKLKNVSAMLENGEVIQIPEISTQPMMELMGSIALSKKCSEGIVDAMQRRFSGEQFSYREQLSLPDFEAYGSVDGVVQVATARNRVFGSRTLGRENIEYRDRDKKLRCHPQMNPPNLQIVENLYDAPVEDRGILNNMGRHLAGFGFEVLRATEQGAEWVGEQVVGGKSVQR